MSTPSSAPPTTSAMTFADVAAHVALLPPPPQLLLFGGSITQGAFPLHAQLASMYTRRLDVLNRGFGGYNTASALTLLPSFFPAVPPLRTHARVAAMVVFFGANDSCSPGEPQHCALEAYKANLRSMVTWEGVRLHRTAVVLVTPAPVEEYRLPHDGEGRASRIALYAQAVRQLGKELRVPVVDLWSAMMHVAGWNAGHDATAAAAGMPGCLGVKPSVELGRLFTDGLHFTAEGYEILTKELIRVLDKQVQECQLKEGEEWYPEWIKFHPPIQSMVNEEVVNPRSDGVESM